MKSPGETATARGVERSSLKRFVAAARRLLDIKVCDRCAQAPATVANGRGTGWCARCSDLEFNERRAGFERTAAYRRAIEAAKAGGPR